MGGHLLDPPDRLAEFAKSGVPVLVAHGEGEYIWPEPHQSLLAERLDARLGVIRGAAHSPAVEAPELTADLLAGFWSDVED